MATRNGKPPRFGIEGTIFSTDQDGLDRIEALKASYVGKPMADQSQLRKEIRKLYETLKDEGHLFSKDGTAFV